MTRHLRRIGAPHCPYSQRLLHLWLYTRQPSLQNRHGPARHNFLKLLQMAPVERRRPGVNGL